MREWSAVDRDDCFYWAVINRGVCIVYYKEKIYWYRVSRFFLFLSFNLNMLHEWDKTFRKYNKYFFSSFFAFKWMLWLLLFWFDAYVPSIFSFCLCFCLFFFILIICCVSSFYRKEKKKELVLFIWIYSITTQTQMTKRYVEKSASHRQDRKRNTSINYSETEKNKHEFVLSLKASHLSSPCFFFLLIFFFCAGLSINYLQQQKCNEHETHTHKKLFIAWFYNLADVT